MRSPADQNHVAVHSGKRHLRVQLKVRKSSQWWPSTNCASLIPANKAHTLFFSIRTHGIVEWYLIKREGQTVRLVIVPDQAAMFKTPENDAGGYSFACSNTSELTGFLSSRNRANPVADVVDSHNLLRGLCTVFHTTWGRAIKHNSKSGPEHLHCPRENSTQEDITNSTEPFPRTTEVKIEQSASNGRVAPLTNRASSRSEQFLH
ncbi:unnamed protein product [Cylindrotheca closterium]|uniref:Uncharacterized protein n=1 Tax=Cylindrotheca closterium TaxID=2856 RepID=A0AAD2CU31_9STRA|nr:unnamed protein product [Cylindrotheca closterium]